MEKLKNEHLKPFSGSMMIAVTIFYGGRGVIKNLYLHENTGALHIVFKENPSGDDKEKVFEEPFLEEQSIKGEICKIKFIYTDADGRAYGVISNSCDDIIWVKSRMRKKYRFT